MYMNVEVTILIDNKVINLRPQGLKAEWGFSALIKAKETILFDAGQTEIAFENYTLLGCENPTKVVLSHGHYDHTGGLMEFLTRYRCKLYTHPDAFLPRFYKGDYIGIPFIREKIETYAEIVEHSEPVEVSKDVWALGEIPRNYEQSLLSDSFIVRDGVKEFDEIKDDQSLAIKTENGILLVLGCCHSGIRNTIEYAEEVLSDEVKFVIGGTHLIAFKDQKLEEIVRWLDRKIDLIAPCHCTGLKNEFYLMKKLCEKFRLVGSGDVIVF